MNVTRGLSVLQIISVRNIDTGEEGALKLNNKVHIAKYKIFKPFEFFQIAELMHDYEKKRNDYIRLMEKKEKGEVDRKRRTQEQIDKERMDARWKFGKVREEMCLVHEAFQFFRQKFRTKYGNYNPGPNVFLR